jgi:hypothetical protein
LATPLRDLVFYRELPVLLGVSEDYIGKLLHCPRGENHDLYVRMRLPKPFWVLPGGIRVWRLRDIEVWALTRRIHEDFGRGRVIPLLDEPEIASRALGRARVRGS